MHGATEKCELYGHKELLAIKIGKYFTKRVDYNGEAKLDCCQCSTGKVLGRIVLQ